MPLARKHFILALLLTFLATGAAAQCEIETSSLVFGTYESRRDSTSTSSMTIRCADAIPFQIDLSQGQGTFRNRQMRSDEGATLIYNLFTNPGFSHIWGDGTAGTRPLGSVSSGGAQVLRIYGRIPRGQQSPPGHYLDNIVITIGF